MKYTVYTIILLTCCCCYNINVLAQKNPLNDIKPVTGNTVVDEVKKQQQNRKKKKKTTTVGKAYQDMTSKYNRYFNARVRYAEGMDKLNENNEENYAEILPVYPYEGGDGITISSDLDEVIKKTSLAVQLKPSSKWVDDCYLLIGQSYYLMGDYDAATKSFKYITSNFDNKIRKTYGKSNASADKKVQEKQNATVKRDKDQARKEREEKVAEDKREKDKARKEREKTKKQDKKAKLKAQAKRKKEQDRIKREKQKIQAKRKKVREKNKKRKKRGKPALPLPEFIQYEKDTTDKTEDVDDKEEVNEEEIIAESEVVEEEEEDEISEVDDGKAYGGEGLLKHKMAKYDAILWLVRTYVQEERHNEAEAVLDIARNDRSFPKRLRGELNTIEAHYFMERKKWDQTQTALQRAIKYTRKKDEKARLYYILGQLKQRDGNYAEAVKAFQKTIKSNADFDMTFNAQLNIAKTRMMSGEYNSERAIAYLEKMLKEDKNEDYLDQIYFTMAEIEMENGDIDKAQEYLAESAAASTSNPKQKAMSYLRLADFNYERENYLLASGYYDSTLTVLAKDYERYDEISNRRVVLTELVKYNTIVALQDSLQRIAKMSDTQRDKYIDELIAQLEEEARKKQLEEEQAFLSDEVTPKTIGSGGGAGSYFDNPMAKTKGKADFDRIWGERPLVDNWRLMSKVSGSGAIAFESDTLNMPDVNELEKLAEQGKLTKEAILEKLPLTPDALAQSDSLIVNGLYHIGGIYRQQLAAPNKAAKKFDELLSRYPSNQYAPQTHYNLYLMAKDKGDKGTTEKHKNSLLTKYPDSVYAKLIEDPDYLSKYNSEIQDLENYYDKTYAFFKASNFQEVTNRSKEVNSLFKNNPLQARFDLLNAMVLGETEGKEAYIKALQKIVASYSTDPVKDKALEILSYLETGKKPKPTSTSAGTNTYVYQPNSKHYVVTALSTYSSKISGTVNKVSNFNQNNFSADRLKVNQMLLNPENQIILVKSFANADKALVYYKTLKENESKVYSELDTGHKIFLISKSNFSKYFKNKNSDEYFDFFLENYKL